MAKAIIDQFPHAKLTLGPAIDTGFYYDVDFGGGPALGDDGLKDVQKAMKKLLNTWTTWSHREVSVEEAREVFAGNQFKLELIEEIAVRGETITLYTCGTGKSEFTDLCRGGHCENPSAEIDADSFKLDKVAGAYWRGDEKNPMLSRVYGLAFETPADLDAYLVQREEAKKRDHRKLGKELDLITIQDEIGPGLVLWHPKGSLIRLLIENFWREQHIKDGYDLVYSPHVARLDLWKTSGHVDYYRENMFAAMKLEGSEYQLKPMNCPFHIMIYKSHLRSYRDLPIRYGELGTVYRYERTGVLHGLLRVRGFTQDDAHLFCRPDQIEAEVSRVLDFTFFVLGTFGFTEFEIYLSTRPEKSVGSDENWTVATNALEAALKSRNVAYQVDPGEGVFYGPKIDIKIKDVLGRAWQCSTVQVDFNNPERFKLAYTGEDGKHHQPIMIHRALMGSIERFFGILIEHYAGAFPTWLAPVQAVVLTITDHQQEFAAKIVSTLKSHGYRVEADLRNEKIGFKIREAEKNKIPYMLVVGDKEVQSGMVAVRGRSGANHGTMPVEQFLELIRTETNHALRDTATHSQTR